MSRYRVHVLWSLSRYRPMTANREQNNLVEDVVVVEAPGPEEAARLAFQEESEELAATNLGLREDDSFAVAVERVECVSLTVPESVPGPETAVR
jgi:hypothetical protein